MSPNMEQQSSPPPGKLRSFSPEKDMEVVADLIEDSFHLKDDPEGQRIVRQMREYAIRQRNGFLPGRAPGPSRGFVWEVEGRVVGNTSIILFDRGIKRINLIANVAVRPEFRNRGIARRLTQHALRVVAQQGLSETWLQVRRDDQRAISLYSGLGFAQFKTLSQWRKEGSKLPRAEHQPRGVISRRRYGDWPCQKRWLDELYPRETRWYSPVDFACFAPYAWLNPYNWADMFTLRHYWLREGDRPLASLTLQTTDNPVDNLWLGTEADGEEDLNLARLLGVFLSQKWNGRPLACEYPADRAEEAFTENGFTLTRTLSWMKYVPPALR